MRRADYTTERAIHACNMRRTFHTPTSPRDAITLRVPMRAEQGGVTLPRQFTRDLSGNAPRNHAEAPCVLSIKYSRLCRFAANDRRLLVVAEWPSRPAHFLRSNLSPFPSFFQGTPLISTWIRRLKDHSAFYDIASSSPCSVAMKAPTTGRTLFVFFFFNL